MDMDMSCGRYRKDANPRTDRGEQDWGRCIRLTEQCAGRGTCMFTRQVKTERMKTLAHRRQ